WHRAAGALLVGGRLMAAPGMATKAAADERRADSADVALLLEGTFPYVAGGVSSWVNQIIRGFPDLRFAVIFIGSRSSDYGAIKYALPDNVVHLENHYLHDYIDSTMIEELPGDRGLFDKVDRMHEYFRAPLSHPESAGLFAELSDQLGSGLDHRQFLYSG